MSETVHDQHVLNLDNAINADVAGAYDWYLDWRPVKAYDDMHPEQPDTNESLVAKVARPAGGFALSA